MIGLSFDTELNRDIGVGYVGRKVGLGGLCWHNLGENRSF